MKTQVLSFENNASFSNEEDNQPIQQSIKVKQFVPSSLVRATLPVNLSNQQSHQNQFSSNAYQNNDNIQYQMQMQQSNIQTIIQPQKPIRKPFLTGGLSQIAPPPQQIQNLSQFNNTTQDLSITDPIQEEDEEENLSFQQELELLEAEPSKINSQPKEEKIIVHNKNLLFDVVPDVQKNTFLSNKVTSSQPKKGTGGLISIKNQSQEKPSLSGLQRVKQVTISSKEDLLTENKSGSQDQQSNKFGKMQQPPFKNEIKTGQQIITQIEKAQPLNQVINKTEVNAQQIQPLNQINIVSNTSQINNYSQQTQQMQQQPLQMPLLQNQLLPLGNLGAMQQNQQPSSYSEQLQQQLNLIMQMHSQLQFQMQNQNGIAGNPFAIQNSSQMPFIQPQNISNQQQQQPNHGNLQNPQNTSNGQTFGLQNQPNITNQLQQFQQSNLSNASQNNLTSQFQKSQQQLFQSNLQQNQNKIIAKPIVSQVVQQPAFKQAYPQDSLFGQFKESLEKPQNNGQSMLEYDLKTKAKYAMSQENFQQNSGRGYQSENLSSLDNSNNKSIISHTQNNYMPQSQPQYPHKSERNKCEAQTDTFKLKRKPLSQVRPSEVYSSAGQSIMNFKPYTQKDYSNLQTQATQQRLGGLGANIGNDDWQKAKLKKDTIQDFSQNVKLQNQIIIRQTSKPPQPPKPKEKTAREKAIEFAKSNVPKPKQKSNSIKEDKNQINNTKDRIENEFGIDENLDDFGTLVDIKANKAQKYQAKNDIALLDMKHQAYLDEVEKIKRNFNIKI
ncbi:UNKNOWN [Stylonychia lemnae]|uniref:Uncharacterized protein n=1 Tax=Stylonychia lemnae TaxID=5949 RepID=A0A078A1Z2_STYLE|nr:UNKNOWN [Stylonychia lemnae]|eukprot:CDW76155.1 UNKNOWN [Stylonychia lemnae]